MEALTHHVSWEQRVYRTVLRQWVWVWLAIGLALHLITADSPLSPDEGGDSFIALHWLSSGGSLYGHYWVDRPPVLVAEYLIGAAFGTIGLRVVGALVAVATAYVTYRLTERLAGTRAARCAVPFVVLALSSGVIGSIRATGELFAVLPGTASIWLLLEARDSQRGVWWRYAAAGALAAVSLLTKQSFVDAMAAGGAYLLALLVLHVRSGLRLRAWAAHAASYVAGAAVPIALTMWWAASTAVGAGGVWYALFGFRVAALRTLAHASTPLTTRLMHLGDVGVASGLLVVVVCALAGLWTLRRNIIVACMLAAWLAAGLFGVLGGGYYWPHYLIQIVPVSAVLAGVALARVRRRFVAVLVAAMAIATLVSLPFANAGQHASKPIAVAGYLQDHAEPGDALYVMYAKANLVYYAHMRAPYPYLWSSMLRAKPDAQDQLRTWLSSGSCPQWIVEWQRPTAFGMDRSGRIRAILARDYEQVAVVHGVPVLHRLQRCGASNAT